MEEDSEESNDDVQGEDKPTVLWERCIQQSIFVDLSEDESLHLSDLERSLALHMSQAESVASEASIHLSGSSELSALDDISSGSSTISSRNVNPFENKTKSSTKYVSAQRPNTTQPPVKPEREDPGQNTSDEDQEELPYDGELRSPYFNHTASSLGHSEGRDIVHESPDPPCLPGLLQEDTNIKLSTSLDAPVEVAPPCHVHADINHLLLRHFSQEELLQSGRLIEAETLPEVSLLESVDDTVLSMVPTYNRPGSSKERSKSLSQNEILEEGSERETNELTSAGSDQSKSSSGGSNKSSKEISEDAAKQEKAEESKEVQRVPLMRTRSFSELKYGQGQVHYPLPDFSKVAPKVKIPKTPSGPVKSIPKPMHRADSSPGMLELIGRVLEDSVQPPEKPYVFKNSEQQTPPALVHHLQVEYDKLLTKYAEAENLIDQMRLGNKPPSETGLYSEQDDVEQVELGEGSPLWHLVPHLPPSENVIEIVAKTTQNTTVKEVTTVSSSQHEESPSDGERMTAELGDIVREFMQKVEDLKFHVTNMSLGTAEQQMMLRSMMEAQDQLERKYISKKEEHRALEMQNYMGLSRNTGTFDPNRLVEGDIFRIGMHLEDIKEMIDRNVYEQISPPHSSSTPTSMRASLHAKPGPLAFDTPSPPASLHEGSSAGFSSPSCNIQKEKDKGEEEEAEETNEVHVNGGLNESRELIPVDPLMQNVVGDIYVSRDLLSSLGGLQVTEEDEGHEEERVCVLSEGGDRSDFLAILNETGSTSSQRERTAKSILNSDDERDLGDCVSLSLAVEVPRSSHPPRDSDIHRASDPPFGPSCASQRIVSPETDSGFGSSYLNQSANGTFKTNLFTESSPSQSDGLSVSDSDGSCSNLDTEINSAQPPAQTRLCGAAAVELWVESTTKEPSVRLQGADQKLQHHVSEPVHSTAMDTVETSSLGNPCSCNSEAILALQTEVARLKKNLEEGLVQLPHLTQKMDYLTSKYREDPRERRSKTRTRQTPASSSLGKSSSRAVSNLTSSQLRIDDWISSDMDPSRSKDTDSGDGSCSEIMLEVHDSPVGNRRHGGNGRSVAEFGDKYQELTRSNRGTERNSSLKRGNDSATESQGPEAFRSFNYRLTASLQKPLLQVSYGSSSSLPASYKVKEPELQSHHRKRSTQSDSALLPSNVYFKRTPSPAAAPSRTVSKTSSRKGKKEEDMNRTLDRAIEVARTMKRTTDCMARRLSADLVKAQLHRKLYNMQPLGGRKHQTF